MSLATNIHTIKKLNKLLTGITWRLVGSSNLAIQGVTIEANDIDIQIQKSAIDVVNQKLASLAVRPIAFSETNIYSSYFGQFIIDGVSVDIMSDLSFKDTPPNGSKPTYHNVVIRVGSEDITCASLQEEYDVSIIRGKTLTAQSIRDKLDADL